MVAIGYFLRTFFISVILLFPIVSLGQNKTINLSKIDMVKDSLYVKMHSFSLDKPDSAFYYHHIISQKHLFDGDSVSYLMNEYATKANLLLKMNRVGLAIIELQKYMQMVTKWGLRVEPFAYVELGNIYFRLKLFPIAESYYKKAIETNLNPLWVYPVCLSNLGMIAKENGNYILAKNYFVKSYSYRLRIKQDTAGSAYCLGLLAEVANLEGKPFLAKQYVAKGFELLNSPCCSEILRPKEYIKFAPDLFLNLLKAYRIEGNLKAMDSIMTLTRNLFKWIDAQHLAIAFELSAAKVYLELSQISRVKNCINEYQKFPMKYRTLADEKDCAYMQLKVHQLEGNRKEEMFWEIAYFKLKDSLELQAGTNDVIGFTSNVLESQNELVKEKQQNEIKEQEEKVIQERKSRQLLTLFLIFLAFVALVIFVFYKRSETDKGLISKQNQEKELLLKEIHHRVKNNLAIVSGILDMQERKLNNPEFQDVFRDAKNRMVSIATVHQTLYEQEDFGKIDAGVYLQQLCKSVYDSYKKELCEVDIKISGNGIFIQPDILVPLALVVNEMLTNSFKYAFKEKEKGEIEIQLQELSEGKVRFSYSDNGPGLQNSEIGSKRKSLGTMLIQGLSKQIGAELQQINSPEGLRYLLQFAIE
jgi:two-component sensor histidine kinase